MVLDVTPSGSLLWWTSHLGIDGGARRAFHHIERLEHSLDESLAKQPIRIRLMIRRLEISLVSAWIFWIRCVVSYSHQQ